MKYCSNDIKDPKHEMLGSRKRKCFGTVCKWNRIPVSRYPFVSPISEVISTWLSCLNILRLALIVLLSLSKHEVLFIGYTS